MIRPLSRTQLAVDISIGAACFLLRVALGALTSTGLTGVMLVVVTLVMAGALAVRRLSPALALAAIWFAAILQVAASAFASTYSGPDLADLAIPVVLYAAGRYGAAPVRWLGLVSALLGAAVAAASLLYARGSVTYYLSIGELSQLARQFAAFIVVFLAAAALFVVSWGVGMLVRVWRASQDARLAAAVAMQQQTVAQREVAVEQERTRIARDMHDVVAHSLAVVIAQSDGARYAMKSDPEAADAALTTISTTAREALADVRVLLGQLRYSQTSGPQPVLEDLDRLLDQVRASGLDVRREDSGEPVPLGTGQQLAVYRIVQESLTNALRHGDRAEQVVVRFVWTARELEIDVSSAMTTDAPAASGGHGIDGMRERAALAGGRLTAAAHGERFRVTAVLPVSALTDALA